MATKEASKDLVVAQTPEDAIEALRGNMVVQVTDPVQIQRQIIEAILDADNADDILGVTTSTVQGSTILGVPFTLNAVQILKSSFNEGLGVFAVLDATMENGMDVKVSTGAGNVMAQAVALWKAGFLPRRVQIIEADNPTANGYRPQRLIAA